MGRAIYCPVTITASIPYVFRCRNCVAGRLHRCRIFLRGILPLRTEAVAAVETTDVYDNRRHGFAYKTGAAVRVRSENDGGVELVSLMIGCKAPQRFNVPDSCRDGTVSKNELGARLHSVLIHPTHVATGW